MTEKAAPVVVAAVITGKTKPRFLRQLPAAADGKCELDHPVRLAKGSGLSVLADARRFWRNKKAPSNLWTLALKSYLAILVGLLGLGDHLGQGPERVLVLLFSLSGRGKERGIVLSRRQPSRAWLDQTASKLFLSLGKHHLGILALLDLRHPLVQEELLGEFEQGGRSRCTLVLRKAKFPERRSDGASDPGGSRKPIDRSRSRRTQNRCRLRRHPAHRHQGGRISSSQRPSRQVEEKTRNGI